MSNPTEEGLKVAQGTSQRPPANWGITEELAADRNRMASENNLMGWIRTSLAMISFGFVWPSYLNTCRRPSPRGPCGWARGRSISAGFW